MLQIYWSRTAVSKRRRRAHVKYS